MEEKKRVGAGVGALIKKGDMFLLGHRHDDPDKANSALHGEGTWTMPGGRLEFGETFEDGIKREVLEETGMRLNNVKVICVSNERVSDAHFVTVGLMCEDFTGEPKIVEPEEITEWKWFPLDNPPSPMFFPSEKVLKNFKEGVFYKY